VSIQQIETKTPILIDLVATPTASWSLVEPAFEIFCACLPCFTPVLKLGRWVSKTATQRSQNSKGAYASNNYGAQNTWNSNLSSKGSHGFSAHREHPYDRFDEAKEMTPHPRIQEVTTQRFVCSSCRTKLTCESCGSEQV
jgi:hypothetical protein